MTTRRATVGSIIHYIRMGYSNYASYFVTGSVCISTSYLLMKELGVDVPFLPFAIGVGVLGIGAVFSIGKYLHYKGGLYEGQLNVDYLNNVWIYKLFPGKERVFAKAYYLMLKKALGPLTDAEISDADSTLRELELLVQGESIDRPEA